MNLLFTSFITTTTTQLRANIVNNCNKSGQTVGWILKIMIIIVYKFVDCHLLITWPLAILLEVSEERLTNRQQLKSSSEKYILLL